MQIKITQQPALIGMQITSPQIELQQEPAHLEIQSSKVEVNITTTRGIVELDSTAAKESLGLYSLSRFSKLMAEKAQQKALEGIARRAEEGTQMANVHKNGFIITRLAMKNAYGGPVSVNTMPKAPLQWKGHPGTIRFDVSVKPLQFNSTSGTVDLEFKRGTVEVYIRQQNYLKIDWVENSVDAFR